MTTLTTDNFIAERQPNGDVWIRQGYWRQESILIPKSQCTELAKLLMWQEISESRVNNDEEWIPNYNQPHRVDYTHYAGEPE